MGLGGAWHVGNQKSDLTFLFFFKLTRRYMLGKRSYINAAHLHSNDPKIFSDLCTTAL